MNLNPPIRIDKARHGQKFQFPEICLCSIKNKCKTKRTGPETRADALGEVPFY
jgi:hypothetical protein